LRLANPDILTIRMSGMGLLREEHSRVPNIPEAITLVAMPVTWRKTQQVASEGEIVWP
jgi:hypothetical protein